MQSIISKQSELEPASSAHPSPSPSTELALDEKELEEIELEMLVEECEDLISKISPSFSHYYLQEEPTLMSEAEESFSMKREKNRLEK